LKPSWTREV